MQMEMKIKLVQLHISEKLDSKTESVIKDKKDIIIISGPIQQQDKTFINTYAYNKRDYKYIKQVLIDIKREKLIAIQ